MENKIQRLKITDVMGVHYFDLINPDPHLIEICGKNRAGKTTILQSVQAALGGKGSIGECVVRDGADEGEIALTIGDMEISVTLREGGRHRLVVRSVETGEKIKRPQTTLDGMLGTLCFDARSFLDWTPAKQEETVRALAGDDYITEAERLQSALDDTISNRLLLSRELKRYGTISPVEPTEQVDTAELLEQIAQAESRAEKSRKQRAALDSLHRERHLITHEIDRLQNQIQEQMKLAEAVEAEIASTSAPLPIEDIAPLRQALADAGKRNARADAYRRYLAEIEERKKTIKAHSCAEREVEEIRRSLRRHSSSAQLPGGLEFRSGKLTANGRPLERLSTSEGTRLAIEVGVALDPDLRLFLIDCAEQFDDLDHLMELAKERGIQFLCATRGEGHTDGAITIEAGEGKNKCP